MFIAKMGVHLDFHWDFPLASWHISCSLAVLVWLYLFKQKSQWKSKWKPILSNEHIRLPKKDVDLPLKSIKNFAQNSTGTHPSSADFSSSTHVAFRKKLGSCVRWTSMALGSELKNVKPSCSNVKPGSCSTVGCLVFLNPGLVVGSVLFHKRNWWAKYDFYRFLISEQHRKTDGPTNWQSLEEDLLSRCVWGRNKFTFFWWQTLKRSNSAE